MVAVMMAMNPAFCYLYISYNELVRVMQKYKGNKNTWQGSGGCNLREHNSIILVFLQFSENKSTKP